MTGAPDPARSCPICGAPNACGAAAGTSGRCWCVDLRFPPELLARVPPAMRDRACICRACATAAQVAPPGTTSPAHTGDDP